MLSADPEIGFVEESRAATDGADANQMPVQLENERVASPQISIYGPIGTRKDLLSSNILEHARSLLAPLPESIRPEIHRPKSVNFDYSPNKLPGIKPAPESPNKMYDRARSGQTPNSRKSDSARIPPIREKKADPKRLKSPDPFSRIMDSDSTLTAAVKAEMDFFGVEWSESATLAEIDPWAPFGTLAKTARRNQAPSNKARKLTSPVDELKKIQQELSFTGERTQESSQNYQSRPGTIPTRIPKRYHFVESSPLPPADSTKYSEYDAKEKNWKVTTFPSLHPISREDVVMLEKWMDIMLEQVSSTTADITVLARETHLLYSICLHEIVRQVSIHCIERGQLTAKIWNRYCQLFEIYLNYEADQRAHIVRELNEKTQEAKELADTVHTLRSMLDEKQKALSTATEAQESIRTQLLELQDSLFNFRFEPGQMAFEKDPSIDSFSELEGNRMSDFRKKRKPGTKSRRHHRRNHASRESGSDRLRDADNPDEYYSGDSEYSESEYSEGDEELESQPTKSRPDEGKPLENSMLEKDDSDIADTENVSALVEDYSDFGAPVYMSRRAKLAQLFDNEDSQSNLSPSNQPVIESKQDTTALQALLGSSVLMDPLLGASTDFLYREGNEIPSAILRSMKSKSRQDDESDAILAQMEANYRTKPTPATEDKRKDDVQLPEKSPALAAKGKDAPDKTPIMRKTPIPESAMAQFLNATKEEETKKRLDKDKRLIRRMSLMQLGQSGDEMSSPQLKALMSKLMTNDESESENQESESSDDNGQPMMDGAADSQEGDILSSSHGTLDREHPEPQKSSNASAANLKKTKGGKKLKGNTTRKTTKVAESSSSDEGVNKKTGSTLIEKAPRNATQAKKVLTVDSILKKSPLARLSSGADLLRLKSETNTPTSEKDFGSQSNLSETRVRVMMSEKGLQTDPVVFANAEPKPSNQVKQEVQSKPVINRTQNPEVEESKKIETATENPVQVTDNRMVPEEAAEFDEQLFSLKLHGFAQEEECQLENKKNKIIQTPNVLYDASNAQKVEDYEKEQRLIEAEIFKLRRELRLVTTQYEELRDKTSKIAAQVKENINIPGGVFNFSKPLESSDIQAGPGGHNKPSHELYAAPVGAERAGANVMKPKAPPHLLQTIQQILEGDAMLAQKPRMKPVNYVLKRIISIMLEFNTMSSNSPVPMSLYEFVYDYYSTRYGLKSITERHLIDFVSNMKKYKDSHNRVYRFGQFCGFYDPIKHECFVFYMAVYQHLSKLSSNWIELNDGSILIQVEKAYNICALVFGQHRSADDLNKLQITIDSISVERRGSHERYVDLDMYLEVMLQTFMGIDIAGGESLDLSFTKQSGLQSTGDSLGLTGNATGLVLDPQFGDPHGNRRLDKDSRRMSVAKSLHPHTASGVAVVNFSSFSEEPSSSVPQEDLSPPDPRFTEHNGPLIRSSNQSTMQSSIYSQNGAMRAPPPARMASSKANPAMRLYGANAANRMGPSPLGFLNTRARSTSPTAPAHPSASPTSGATRLAPLPQQPRVSLMSISKVVPKASE